MESVPELLSLIRQGAGTPVSLTLSVPHAEELTGRYGWVMEPKLFALIDAAGLTVHRSPAGVHVLRGGADVLRGVGQDRWLFEGREVPAHAQVGDLAVFSPTGCFLDQERLIREMNLIDAQPDRITSGEIAGRETWVVPSAAHSRFVEEDHPRLIELDREYGTLLAVETARERVEVTTVSFPTGFSGSRWDGPITDWRAEWEGQRSALEEPVQFPPAEEVPGLLAQLPAHPTDPRRLRIYIGDGSLEGAYPRYRVGRSERLPLAFRLSSPPLPELRSTRRGWVRHVGEPTSDPQWPVIFSGDGWSSYANLSVPVQQEAELEGWFDYSAWDPESVWNDVKVERIYVSLGTYSDPQRVWQEVEDTADAYGSDDIGVRDVILDVTLDGAVPPPLTPELFRPGAKHVEGSHLWIRDWAGPVLRCWDLRTGRYLGQSLVPVSLRDAHFLQFGEGVIQGAQRAWRLSPGSTVTAEVADWIPPDEEAEVAAAPLVPEPWEIDHHLSEGLYSLVMLTEEGSRTALGRRGGGGEMEICPIDTGGFTISRATRVGERYFVDCWQLHLVIGPDFRVESVEHSTMDHIPWRWSAEQGIAVQSAGPELSFIGQDTGREITRWAVPEGHFVDVRIDSPTRFVVLIHPEGAERWERPAPTGVAEFDGESWATVELEEAPREI
ncbi:hypothetical protein EAH68_02850 [Corynebacterium hylobatis]|uniref:Uncharacterized protein n=1 Tax=Corynebacterium hylobatis TaxID=1859290 RepID=A0A430I0H6_9CORY|nr:hypothetical protein [Corynebacterium hylobatis]RSZ65102.1 hypothetical protein EAH68_02850 [Corynebacterium hylobatis]